MLVAAVLASRLALASHHMSERRAVRHDIAEGFRWLWRHAAMRTLTLTIVAFNVTFGAAWSVLVLYALERLHAGKVGFGLLTTATAIGGLGGAAIYQRLAARVPLGKIMQVGLIIETLTHLSLALTRSTVIALAVMFVFGIHAQVWGVTGQLRTAAGGAHSASRMGEQRVPHRRAGRHRRRRRIRWDHRRAVPSERALLVRLHRLSDLPGHHLTPAPQHREH
jgi:MFS-type transporter involved in bile tolerance (Atg22 family)